MMTIDQVVSLVERMEWLEVERSQVSTLVLELGGPILAQQVHEKQSFCTYMLPHPLLIE